MHTNIQKLAVTPKVRLTFPSASRLLGCFETTDLMYNAFLDLVRVYQDVAVLKVFLTLVDPNNRFFGCVQSQIYVDPA
jgi:hypothetical protein